jgi:hypothetical protein
VDSLPRDVEMVGNASRDVDREFLNIFNNITPNILAPSAHPGHWQPILYLLTTLTLDIDNLHG